MRRRQRRHMPVPLELHPLRLCHVRPQLAEAQASLARGDGIAGDVFLAEMRQRMDALRPK